MVYIIKEIFYSLQGEGAQTGRAAVFCRFSGCNLWSGQEKDRNRAICQFCDTDFIGTDGKGGGRFYNTDSLVQAIAETWQAPYSERPYAILTGGEPLLQVDTALVDALHQIGFEIGLETNGTRPLSTLIDWVCVSPKTTELQLTQGDELKFIFPHPTLSPEQFINLDFKHFFLQPMADENVKKNTQLAVEYCLKHPKWRLSLQTHKWLNIP